MTQSFKKTATFALTAVFSVAAMSATAAAGEYKAPQFKAQTTAQLAFDQSRVDPILHAHQTVGNPYTVMGQTYTPAHNPRYDMVGNASWYGAKFHGKLTASGEKFDKNAMTAAHKTLPLNSLVVVTNLTTGQAITVRINDRGPFIGNGVIDLSEAAATAIGYTVSASGPVRVQYAGAVPLNKPAPKKEAMMAVPAPSIMPQISLPRAPIAAPQHYAEIQDPNNQVETLTVKGPVHMASYSEKSPKARFIRAVYRTTTKK